MEILADDRGRVPQVPDLATPCDDRTQPEGRPSGSLDPGVPRRSGRSSPRRTLPERADASRSRSQRGWSSGSRGLDQSDNVPFDSLEWRDMPGMAREPLRFLPPAELSDRGARLDEQGPSPVSDAAAEPFPLTFNTMRDFRPLRERAHPRSMSKKATAMREGTTTIVPHARPGVEGCSPPAGCLECLPSSGPIWMHCPSGVMQIPRYTRRAPVCVQWEFATAHPTGSARGEPGVSGAKGGASKP
jgi:hypothetical protein